jgi:hypothetical protein
MRPAGPLHDTRAAALGVVLRGALAAAALGLAPGTRPAAAAEEELAAAAAAAAVEKVSIEEAPITPQDRRHWAFRPPARSPPPAVRDAARARNAIDLFVMARLEAAGLPPAPEADPLTLLRRLRFDLTGLPPTVAEVEAFLADGSSAAYEALVERLLASRAHAERWALHWLDLARFAETDGFEHDNHRPNAWRYRDWVVDAFERDVPYDELIALQLAGDEVRPDDPDALVATGFALSGPDMPDINDQAERRHTLLNEMTATVGSVFLGLQMGCAQCHDHKSDPISQADFYRLRAFFDGAEVFKERPLAAGEGAPVARALGERAGEPQPSRLMIRGLFNRPGPEVEAAVPRVVAPPGGPLAGKRRADLGRWLAAAENPLSARVIVNRLWHHLFGGGLVGTPSDFGLLGERPTHPELLDWLATELQRLDWSLKRLTRLMVLSSTYRQTSRLGAPAGSAEERAAAAARWQRALEADPENILLGRANRKRLEAEAIRDALLAASGALSPRRGGPGIMVPLPEEVLRAVRKDHWTVSPDEEDHRRRSIYLFVRRNLRLPLFEVFDRPDTNASCPRRDRSTTAPQALTLMNSEETLARARDLARLVSKEAGEDREAAIDLAYRRTLARAPAASERAEARAFLEAQAVRAGGDAPLASLALVLFNLSEFIYVD